MTLKNKKLLAGAVSVFLLLILILPVLIYAKAGVADGPYSTGLIKCGNAASSTGLANPCDFSDFIKLINDIITWIISIASVIFTISAIYGGFLYITSGDNPGNKSKATGILWNTVIGFVIILTAWVIVYTILTTLVDTSSTGTPGIFNFLGKI